MENKTKTLFVDVATVCHDLGSLPSAHDILRR